VVKQKPEVFFGSDRFELIAHMLGKSETISVCQCVSPLHRSEVGRTTSRTGSQDLRSIKIMTESTIKICV